MKVLFISTTPTHPTNAGNRARIRNLVEAVERLGHEVHFALVSKGRQHADVAMTQRYASRLHVLSYRPRRNASWLVEHIRRRALRPFGADAGYRWSLDAWYDGQITPLLKNLQDGHQFDAVIVEYLYLSRALEAFDRSVVKIIDTHDMFTDRHRLFSGSATPYDWFSVSQRDERRGLARADAVLAIQGEEAAVFRALLPASIRVETVGHVFDSTLHVRRAENHSAILVGSANPINVEAANYLVGEVLPKVIARLPSFKLLLAGDVATTVPDSSAVSKLGRVLDMAVAYQQAALAINPVRSGTGLCIKSLETMALGVPLVTTRSGARGLEAFSGSAFVMVADDNASELADAIVTLLQDPVRADRMAQQAREAALAFNEAQLSTLRSALSRERRSA